MSDEVKVEERCPFFYCSDKAAGIQCIKTASAHHCDFGPNAHDRYQEALVGRASSWGNDLVKLLTDPAPFTQPAIPGYNQWNDWFQTGQAYSQPGAGEQYWTTAGLLYNEQMYAQYGNPPAAAGSPCALKPHPYTTSGVTYCGPECEYRKAEPAKPMPFKRASGCPLSHDTPTMCLNCEDIIADRTVAHSEINPNRVTKPIARERYEPLHGAFVGRVLTPVGR